MSNPLFILNLMEAFVASVQVKLNMRYWRCTINFNFRFDESDGIGVMELVRHGSISFVFALACLPVPSSLVFENN